jgi:hypothetical protein
MHRLTRHLRANVVAYLALFLAIGGGGGYAIAATTAKTIHGCVVTKTGEVLVKAKCAKGQKALVWNKAGVRGSAGARGTTGAPGPAGQNAVVAFGEVATNGVALNLQGMSIAQASPGVFTVTVTAPSCAGTNQVPVVSPLGFGAAGPPEVSALTNLGSTTFTVDAGQNVNGTYSPGNQGFFVQDACTSTP